MKVPDLSYLTATQANTDLQNRHYSAEALVNSCLDRITQYNPHLNALVTINPGAALEQARKVDALRSTKAVLPCLSGIPITVKDVFATHDLRTTAGYRPLSAYQPAEDATVVARWRTAGAILLGKSNLSELAGAPHCWNPLFGLTRNPWNPSLTPGGSSGGAAVAIASGFSLLELGSDIGGSIRIPAAYCGVTGFKATENRIPRTGHIPHLPGGIRSVWHMLSLGVLARCVRDVMLSYPLLVGPDEQDSTVPPALTANQPEQKADAPLRIALWTDFSGLPLCERTQAGLTDMVRKLKTAGHTVVECTPCEFNIPVAWQAFGAIGGGEIGLGIPAWQRYIAQFGRCLLPHEERILHSFVCGLSLDFNRYNTALNQREYLIQVLEAFLSQWDVVLCPVAPAAPYRGHPMPAMRHPPRLSIGDKKIPYLEATVSMTIPFSLTGHPVLVLPVSIQDGVPIGIQMIGKRWQEGALLSTGERLEAALGGFIPPPLASLSNLKECLF